MSYLPEPVLDDERFLAVIRAASADEEDANDWTHLLDESPIDLSWHEPQMLIDMFVLCRSRDELFGETPVGGWLEAFAGVGDYDEEQISDISCVISVRLSDDLAICGRYWLTHELFGSDLARATTKREWVLAALRVIGAEASRIVERYNSLTT